MKKKNPLSLFELSYRKTYYFTHPVRFVKEIWRDILNFFHRGRYGYSCVDVWGFYYWWATAGAEALRYMAKHHCGYPGTDEYSTPEAWEKHLNELADQLDWCRKSCDLTSHEKSNEYWKILNAIYENKRTTGTDDRGFIFTKLSHLTPEEEDVIRRYSEREEELALEDDEKRAAIFEAIGRNLGRYWD